MKLFVVLILTLLAVDLVLILLRRGSAPAPRAASPSPETLLASFATTLAVKGDLRLLPLPLFLLATLVASAAVGGLAWIMLISTFATAKNASTPVLIACVLACWVVPAGMALCARRGLLLAPDAQIDVFADAVRLPQEGSFGPTIHTVHALDVSDVWTIGGDQLVLEAAGKRFLVPRKHLREPLDLERLKEMLSAFIAARPGGMSVLERGVSHTSDATAFLARPVWLTPGVVSALALVFVLQLAARTVWPEGEALVRLGANVRALVQAGEWWRLASANLLHVNLMHVFFNGMFLWSLGPLCERALGAARYSVVLVVSAIAGAAAAIAVDPMVVGASTACYGILGSLLVLARARELPTHLAPANEFWIRNLALSLALPLVGPISWAGHGGGFVAGAAATAILRTLPSVQGVRALAVLVTSAFLLGVGLAAWNAVLQLP